MPRKCCIASCNKSKEKNTAFHELPTDPKRRALWLHQISPFLRDTDKIDCFYVCGHHFEEGCYVRAVDSYAISEKRKLLRKDAIPTKFEGMSKDSPRPMARRAASKEALKQIMLLGDEKRYEISSDDDVIEVEIQPPKKKLKLSNRKSSEGNDHDLVTTKSPESAPFDLEVVIEDLSPAQQAIRDRLHQEQCEVDSKIDQLLANPNTELIYKGTYTSHLEVTENVQKILNQAAAPPAPTPSTSTAPPAPNPPSIVLQQQPGTTGSYQLVMDPRLGVIVGAVPTGSTTPATPPLQLYQPKTATVTPGTTVATAAVVGRGRGRSTIVRATTSEPPPLLKTTPKQVPVGRGKQIQVKQNLIAPKVINKSPSVATKAITKTRASIHNSQNTIPPAPVSSFKHMENSVEGGLGLGRASTLANSIDLTSDDGRPQADTREVSFNKLQGRTYPSLVVVARPHLRVKDLASDRAKLDVKVKTVLMYPPTKFTEWLIQQGLVRSDQKCAVHSANSLKLGMYSDASKFPYSGGYVWISECCPQRFVSVFSGSLFEGSQHPPMSILKLLYHWCCQTIVQNVTQWVKVDNLYVKGMYTWLRAVCTVAIHSHVKQLGGPGIKVQVGVISLGTTSQDGNKREVKVEVLGILETATRRLRLRAVEPLAEGEKNHKKRFTKILEPVFNWVHPASVIVTDLTVDKATLNQMGFLNVTQSTSTDYNNSNRTIMEYLRRIVPRMFQNTLSLLSRQIIQQFLDELVWREWYGNTVMQCFDNMVQHLSEQTRCDSSQSLIVRLNKVSANPFKNWPVSLPSTTTSTIPPKSETVEAPRRYSRQRKQTSITTPSPSQNLQRQASPPVVQEVGRPTKSTSPDVPEQLVPLENYYYGTLTVAQECKQKITLNVKCPFCKLNFTSNISLMNHLFKHAHNVSNDVQLCKYCLTIVPSGTELLKHIGSSHPDETKFDNGFVCLICESHFRNPFILGKHMSKEHCPSELPYLCGTCGFRCSNHKQAVDHFYHQHDHGGTIQCPFCMKSTTIYSSGRNVTQNMNFFVQHLQKHQKKHLAKRCGRCTLWFIQKETLKEHKSKMHISQRGKRGLVPSFAPRNGVMVPKSKTDRGPDDTKEINFTTLHYSINNSLKCKECGDVLSNPKHFVAFENCRNANCSYSTYCSTAMSQHLKKCKEMHERVPQEPLPFELFCICGYRDLFGNSMAKHLTICERKSAYPSRQAAKFATVQQCMLDVLGLVRKDEGTKNNSTKPLILKRSRVKKLEVTKSLGETVEKKKTDSSSRIADAVEIKKEDETKDNVIEKVDTEKIIESTDMNSEEKKEEVTVDEKEKVEIDSNSEEMEKDAIVENEKDTKIEKNEEKEETNKNSDENETVVTDEKKDDEKDQESITKLEEPESNNENIEDVAKPEDGVECEQNANVEEVKETSKETDSKESQILESNEVVEQVLEEDKKESEANVEKQDLSDATTEVNSESSNALVEEKMDVDLPNVDNSDLVSSEVCPMDTD